MIQKHTREVDSCCVADIVESSIVDRSSVAVGLDEGCSCKSSAKLKLPKILTIVLFFN